VSEISHYRCPDTRLPLEPHGTNWGRLREEQDSKRAKQSLEPPCRLAAGHSAELGMKGTAISRAANQPQSSVECRAGAFGMGFHFYYDVLRVSSCGLYTRASTIKQSEVIGTAQPVLSLNKSSRGKCVFDQRSASKPYVFHAFHLRFFYVARLTL